MPTTGASRGPRVEYPSLPTGDYRFEVVAIDRDMVYSEEPAVVSLAVHPPYERYGLMSGLGIAIVLVVWQTVRVLRRDHTLRESNQALSDANHELFGMNIELQQDRAVARLRAEVQAMESAEDLRELKAIGVIDQVTLATLNYAPRTIA